MRPHPSQPSSRSISWNRSTRGFSFGVAGFGLALALLKLRHQHSHKLGPAQHHFLVHSGGKSIALLRAPGESHKSFPRVDTARLSWFLPGPFVRGGPPCWRCGRVWPGFPTSKESEITAARSLLGLIDLTGALVTGDAFALSERDRAPDDRSRWRLAVHTEGEPSGATCRGSGLVRRPGQRTGRRAHHG